VGFESLKEVKPFWAGGYGKKDKNLQSGGGENYPFGGRAVNKSYVKIKGKGII
jgi:hypothetical protein